MKAIALKTILAAIFASAVVAPVLAADAYPSKPIQIITGYATGGVASMVTRLYADQLAKQLNTSVVVLDKPGASNSIGARLAMAARPDGYTLLSAGINSHPILFKGGMDLQKEMEPVAVAGVTPLAFLTSAVHNLKSVNDVVAFAKANPGKLDFASSGGGAQMHLMMSLFAERTGITYTHIPFRGTSEIQTAIGRGHVHITLLSAPSSQPIIETGKAHAVMIGSSERSSILPDTPTPAELGIKPFSVDSFQVIYAPKGTPKDIIQKINAASIQIAKDPAFIEAIRTRTGAKPYAYTPEQTRAMVDEKLRELEDAVRAAGYKP